ncbi:hypothetical protein ACVIW3_002286 [Bradyrhizobium diazoefficiens]
MSSTCLRIRFSKVVRRSSPSACSGSVAAPSASSWPASSTIETRCGFSPLTAEATRWRMALDLLRLQRAADPHHDRGGRLRRLAREQRALGQHQMDAGGLDAVDGTDGAGELAFQRAQMIDVLDERGGAERVRLVEHLVADAAALGQAALGELHPQPRHLVLGHHDDGALIAQLELDGLAFQVLDNAGRIFHREVGEQRRHLRRGDPHDDEREEADERGGDRDHRPEAGGADTF